MSQLEAPATRAARPTAQAVQEAAAVPAEYEPAGQPAQPEAPDGDDSPARQAAQEPLPAELE